MLLRIGPSFKKVSARCYLEHEHGYVFMPNPTVVTLRLLPNILAGILVALSLPLPGSILIPVILSLSITIVTKMINTFKKTIPVMDFIKRLIRHIPEKHFKMIRYGGLYARHRSIDKNSISLFRKKNGILSVVLTGGVLRSFLLLAMIL